MECIGVRHFIGWIEKASLKKTSHELRPALQGASRKHPGEDDSSLMWERY